VLHDELSQQGCAVAPHGTTLPFAQMLPAEGDSPLGWHEPPEQQPAELQAPPLQQGCPGLPQATMPPFWHTPPSMPGGGAAPDARHDPPMQQPPALQVLPQHAPPAAPHAGPASPASPASAAGAPSGVESALASCRGAVKSSPAASLAGPAPSAPPPLLLDVTSADPSPTAKRSKL
jgi:hypothetical protein